MDVARRDTSSLDRMLGRALPIVIVLAVTFALFPSLVQLNVLWTELGDAGYGHGPLLALVTLWLLWQTEPDERAGPRHGRGLAAAALLVVSIVWAAALASSTSSAGQALWPLACWLALAAIYGWPASRAFALPLALLYFALPIWGPFTNLVLWPLTIKVSSLFVQLIGLNAYVDRNFITIPSGSFEIITGCSGQHFFLVACVIGLLIARLNALTGRQFWVVLLAAAAFAIVINWIRVILIVIVGYVTEMRHPMVAEGHLTFGWLLFAGVILIYCLWARWYLGRLPEMPTSSAPSRSAGLPVNRAELGLRSAAVAVAVIVGPLWYQQSEATNRVAAREPADLRLPVLSQEWVGPLLSESPLRPQFAGAAAERFGSYSRSEDYGARVHVFANLYVEQRQGAELVGFSNVVLADSLWDLTSVESSPASEATSGFVPQFREFSARDVSGTRWVIRHTNVIAGRTIAADWESKIALGLGALAMQAPRAGFVALAAPCTDSCDSARGAVESAWTALAPDLLLNFRNRRGNG
jgi:EpsI family protein